MNPERATVALMLAMLVVPMFPQDTSASLAENDITRLRERAEQGDADAQFNLGVMYATNPDGSDRETLLTGLSAPDNIALDVAAGKMYWMDEVERRIKRANLDGSGGQTP